MKFGSQTSVLTFGPEVKEATYPPEIHGSDLETAGVHIDREVREPSGIVIVDGFPVDDPQVTEMVSWWVAGVIGSLVSQSVMGELTPHTDPADFLTFLCLNPAVEGGESWFVSAMTLYRILRNEHPELLERHERGWRYHRFGEQPGDHPTIPPQRVPTYSTCDGGLSAR